MPKIFLKKNEDKRIRSGHLWIFSNEIQNMDNQFQSGDIIEVCNSKDQFLGNGFYNKNSLIAVRLLNSSFAGNFYSYAESMLKKAYDLRRSVYPDRNSFRLCFSESDFMPGLIIDKYNFTYVLQVYSLGINNQIAHIIEILKKDFNAENIFTMHDTVFRKLEGLPEEDEIYFGTKQDEIIDDGKIKYKIDFTRSQKTGFYFDQCDNREFTEKLVNGKTVLDAFCNSGGFGMHAALAGAKIVDFVDSSDFAIENTKFNYNFNELSADAHFFKSDVFDFLQKKEFNSPLGRMGGAKKYDVVILDPPAFAKNKKSVPTALKGYEKLNRDAIKIINDGGFLITSSCSHHINENDFINTINHAANKIGKNLQLVYFNGASLDHPRLPAMPETTYLKFAVFILSHP